VYRIIVGRIAVSAFVRIIPMLVAAQAGWTALCGHSVLACYKAYTKLCATLGHLFQQRTKLGQFVLFAVLISITSDPGTCTGCGYV
jgi:hypothetical protein